MVVMAEERFTIQPGGLAAQSELALIFDLRDGLITRLLVVEDPPAWEPGPGVAAELQEDLCRAGCRPQPPAALGRDGGPQPPKGDGRARRPRAPGGPARRVTDGGFSCAASGGY